MSGEGNDSDPHGREEGQEQAAGSAPTDEPTTRRTMIAMGAPPVATPVATPVPTPVPTNPEGAESGEDESSPAQHTPALSLQPPPARRERTPPAGHPMRETPGHFPNPQFSLVSYTAEQDTQAAAILVDTGPYPQAKTADGAGEANTPPSNPEETAPRGSEDQNEDDLEITAPHRPLSQTELDIATAHATRDSASPSAERDSSELPRDPAAAITDKTPSSSPMSAPVTSDEASDSDPPANSAAEEEREAAPENPRKTPMLGLLLAVGLIVLLGTYHLVSSQFLEEPAATDAAAGKRAKDEPRAKPPKSPAETKDSPPPRQPRLAVQGTPTPVRDRDAPSAESTSADAAPADTPPAAMGGASAGPPPAPSPADDPQPAAEATGDPAPASAPSDGTPPDAAPTEPVLDGLPREAGAPAPTEPAPPSSEKASPPPTEDATADADAPEPATTEEAEEKSRVGSGGALTEATALLTTNPRRAYELAAPLLDTPDRNDALEVRTLAACAFDDGLLARKSFRSMRGADRRTRAYDRCLQSHEINLRYYEHDYHYRELNRMSQRAFDANEYAKAYELARTSFSQRRTAEAAVLLGKTNCALNRKARAEVIATNSREETRQEIVAYCATKGITIELLPSK